MATRVSLLIVSGRLEVKRALLKILDGLQLNVYVAGNIKQAEDALQEQAIELVLCDERLLDGTYHDVLAMTVDRVPKTQFILLLAFEQADERREAFPLGITEVIRPRFEPTDVELALIHAMAGSQGAAQTA